MEEDNLKNNFQKKCQILYKTRTMIKGKNYFNLSPKSQNYTLLKFLTNFSNNNIYTLNQIIKTTKTQNHVFTIQKEQKE